MDSLYMAIITVTTVGFSEVHPLSVPGRVFTAILIVLGVGGITFTFTSVTNYIVAGELRGFLKERKMQRVIDTLSGHYVVCGFGEMGRQVCQELRRKSCELVVVDIREEAVAKARDLGFLALQGDAGVDVVLKNAGISRASGLVVATNEDATNLLVVLSARVLRADMPVVARANLEEVAKKLQRVGADRVISPQSIAGRRMAQMLLNPEICEFLDIVSHDESLELLLENFRIVPHSILSGKSLRDSRIRELTGASIVGLKRPGEGILSSLKPDSVLETGDIVFALGTREQVESLSLMIESTGS
jgi:voltage-gated potassium channel